MALRALVRAQLAVLNLRRTKGAIIDMHASNGNGVELPQKDMFRDTESKSSARIAAEEAAGCTPYADVILCESNKKRRDQLKEIFSDSAMILASNRQLLRMDLRTYGWLLVLNDPCGHSGHAIDVLAHIRRQVPRSDFIISFNEGSLGRHLGVRRQADDSASEAAGHLDRTKACRAATEKYMWMRDHTAWATKLGKKHVVRTIGISGRKGFKGRLLLVTDYVAEGLRNMRRLEWLTAPTRRTP